MSARGFCSYCKIKSYLGLNHGRSLCSQLFHCLEHIHNTFTLQALNQDTQSTEHSCSTHTSTVNEDKEEVAVLKKCAER